MTAASGEREAGALAVAYFICMYGVQYHFLILACRRFKRYARFCFPPKDSLILVGQVVCFLVVGALSETSGGLELISIILLCTPVFPISRVDVGLLHMCNPYLVGASA